MNKENNLLKNKRFSFSKDLIEPMSSETDNSIKIINDNFSIFEKDSNFASIEYFKNKDINAFIFTNTRKKITPKTFLEVLFENRMTSYSFFENSLNYSNYIFSSSMDYLIDFYKSSEEKENISLKPFGYNGPISDIDENMA